ncbi:MAG: cytochrome b/b6 domain-containing protein [Actinomycetes bacterium]|jgi:Ni/Fe-hydrogenase 1 B-type cytochrome subunit|nr:cytochrome b/b6 domain-containing protein [Actinomycetes bacterium]
MAHKPVREGHPVVFIITHWINLLAMLFLTLSGLYIHYPIFAGLMGVARGTHFFWMFVLIINLCYRIVASFFVKTTNMPGTREVDTDIKNWLPQEANKHQMWPTIKYYLFFKKDYPISAKYASLQKIAYLATIPITFLAAYTGFCLWGPTSQWGIFQAGTRLWASWFNWGGGADLMPMRILHYWIMWVILIFTAVHAYLANIYNFAPSKMIFARIEDPDALEGH